MPDKQRVRVAVGVIYRNGHYYVSKRASHLHQGGKWEFPGGKIEPDETEFAALNRELAEEVGIHVKAARELLTIEHNYPDKQVRLFVYLVEDFEGEPRQQEGQQAEWVALNQLRTLSFPEANQAILDALAAIA
jgi:8-oxo-dGTP diphosphatase